MTAHDTTGWCPVCGKSLTLIDADLKLPAHTWPNWNERYDRLCPGSGERGIDHLPLDYNTARQRWSVEL